MRSTYVHFWWRFVFLKWFSKKVVAVGTLGTLLFTHSIWALYSYSFQVVTTALLYFRTVSSEQKLRINFSIRLVLLSRHTQSQNSWLNQGRVEISLIYCEGIVKLGLLPVESSVLINLSPEIFPFAIYRFCTRKFNWSIVFKMSP